MEKASRRLGKTGQVIGKLARDMRKGAHKADRSMRKASRCIGRYQGWPHKLPSRKSVKRYRGTPQWSTIPIAEPIVTVGIPAASMWQATKLTVWWRTDYTSVRIIALAPSYLMRLRVSSASRCMVVDRLYSVGTP